MVLGAARAAIMTPTGAAGYVANPVNPNGGHLTYDGTLTGIADGTNVTMSVWMRPTGTGIRRVFTIASVADSRLILRVLANQTVEVAGRDSSAVEILLAQFGTVTNDAWHHFMLSFNLANAAQRWAYLDGAAASATWAPYNTAGIIDLAATPSPRLRVFSNPNTTAGDLWAGSIADLWVNDSLLDLSVTGNRAKFILNGSPVDLGADGSTPIGSQPALFFSGPTASWHTNKGTGGGATEVGTLLDGTSPVGL